MKRFVGAALTAVTLCASGVASADWSIGGGFEGFQWKESTTPSVEESGIRLTLDLTWQQSKQPGPSVEYNLKFYRGDVDYRGATLFTGIPLSGESRYRGWTNEVRAVWRSGSAMDFVLGMGLDQWERTFPGSGQEEDYNVLYTKLGMAFNNAVRSGVIGSIGAKYVIWARENAHFETLGATANPKLRPGRDFSFYGTLGYRVNPQWDVIGYYDSYRFKQSNAVVVPFAGGTAAFVQPKSDMDVIGVKIQHNF